VRLLSQMDRSFKAREQAQYYTILPVQKKLSFGELCKILPEGQFREDRAAMNLLL
jgi:hypothetical protein